MELETISLNLTPRGIRKRVQANYGDVGPVLKMAVYQGDDVFPLTGMSAVLKGTKQGGTGFSVACTVSGNMASAALTSAMTDDPGIAQAELEITDGQNTYHTENFELVIEAPAHTKDTIDGDAETVQNSLTKMLKELATGLTGPTVALRVSDMIDHSKIYLYEGTETGYSAGYLYYYSGSAWTKGNQYASVTSAIKLMQLYNSIYPVGSIYTSTSSTDPATIFGGKWTRLKDRFLLAAGDTYSAGSTGGEAAHTLTSAEMPAHAHNLSSDARAHAMYWGMSDATIHAAAAVSSGAGTASDNDLGTIQKTWAQTATAGKGQAHNNMPPYIAVYVWQRTALASLSDSSALAEIGDNGLEQAITNANTAKSKLDTSIATANTTQTAIDAKIAAAKTNLAALQSENYKSSELLNGVEDVKAYIGMCDDDMIGVEIDYNTGKYTRLGAAEGLSAGSNFDQFPMFGGRKRCNLADDGTINAYYGDSGYKEDGSNGQVMVYQPAFYYKVVPLKLEKQNPGIGYHLRKARYYVSANPHPGFKLHPAFYNAAGNEVDHIFLSAYEASIYDTSASAYLKLDEQVMDTSADKLCSIAGVKPASGYSQALTRPAIELLAQNRGKNWHGDLIKAESANQLLMLIEYAGNLQNLIEQGDVTFPYTGLGGSDNESYAVDTGGTASLGNATGHAASSTQHINGNTLTNTVNGKRSISYRGMENPWGNIWKWIYGINIWGDGSMCGGQPYICKDFTFAENKNSDNYEAAGFTLTNANGFISAVGYSASCDWTFLPSECKGNDSIPIGDYSFTEKNANGFRIARLGARWNGGSGAGGFCWVLSVGVGDRNRSIGGRLLYMP